MAGIIIYHDAGQGQRLTVVNTLPALSRLFVHSSDELKTWRGAV